MDDEWYLKFVGMCNSKIESTEPLIASAKKSASNAKESAAETALSVLKAEAIKATLDLGLEIHNGSLCAVYNA